MRLQTKNIYSELNSIIEILNSRQASTIDSMASVFHLSEKQFIILLRVLGLTSRECNHEKIKGSHIEGDEEDSDMGCLSYPPYSSSFVFEFDNEANSTANNTVAAEIEQKWRVKIKYNGKLLSLCGDSEGCTLDDLKLLIKRDLYGTNEDYYCEVTGSNGSRDFVLLACMFASIFVFLSSLFCFFAILTKVKSSEINLKYRQAHAIFNLPTPSDKSASII